MAFYTLSVVLKKDSCPSKRARDKDINACGGLHNPLPNYREAELLRGDHKPPIAEVTEILPPEDVDKLYLAIRNKLRRSGTI